MADRSAHFYTRGTGVLGRVQYYVLGFDCVKLDLFQVIGNEITTQFLRPNDVSTSQLRRYCVICYREVW